MTSSTSPSRGGEPTFSDSITIRSPGFGVDAEPRVSVLAGRSFPAVCFLAADVVPARLFVAFSFAGIEHPPSCSAVAGSAYRPAGVSAGPRPAGSLGGDRWG